MDANKLRAFRDSYSLTQTQMAKVLNTPLRTYQNWEQGRFIPGTVATIFELLLIAAIFNPADFDGWVTNKANDKDN